MNSPTFEQIMELTRTISGCAALEDAEAKGLYDACLKVPINGLVVEVGCQLGRSSSLIRQMALSQGFHTIHIDPYYEQPEYLVEWMRMMKSIRGDFTFLHMPTERSEWVMSGLGPIDLAFIDGDHEAHMVEIDLRIIGNRVRPGGLLTAHDYANEGLPGVKQALGVYTRQNAEQWDEVGVYGSLGVWRRK